MDELKLFKDRIPSSCRSKTYGPMIAELRQAVRGGETALKLLLFGTAALNLYAETGKYQHSQHESCTALDSDARTEKRLCRCLYYYNSPYNRACSDCDYQDRYILTGDFRIVDYEVPAHYCADKVGEIDLVLQKGDRLYAAEVKPYQKNKETLLRMIAEVLTYTLGCPAGKYEKAILFFKTVAGTNQKTPQQLEYEQHRPELDALLQEAGITVLRFEEAGDRMYTICKL